LGRSLLKAVLWGAAVAVFLRFGLEPTGWLFYEASFALGVDWLYWGYSAFRGAGFAFGLWQYQVLACVATGILVGLFTYHRANKRVAQ
jgi:hypothetical protein